MFKGIKSKLKNAFKAKPKKKNAAPKKAVKKPLKQVKPVKKIVKPIVKPAKKTEQKSKVEVKKPAVAPKKTMFKEVVKQENVASGYFEEVTVTCSGCGKQSKIIKYSGIDMANYQCQKCSGVESEFGDDYG